VGVFKIRVTNPRTSTAPQVSAELDFRVISATTPAITTIVDSASYLAAAKQSGTDADPVQSGGIAVSPRELITIFGQNLGPSTAQSTTPALLPLSTFFAYPTVWGGVTVTFQIPGVTGAVAAPLIMVSANQINAVEPQQVAKVVGEASPGNQVRITVTNGALAPASIVATATAANPGIFSFDGMGKGQAAVLNYDAVSGSYIINSTNTPAAKGATILIYATGLGDLLDPNSAIADGQVATGATPLKDLATVSVAIGPQPAVVTYAGTTPQAVAGLVQINAIVPPPLSSPATYPITVSVGDSAGGRTSQGSITLSIK
jgi:uncharacterized protein (TIGR03437 family)